MAGAWQPALLPGLTCGPPAGNLPGFPRFFALGNLIPLLMFMP